MRLWHKVILSILLVLLLALSTGYWYAQKALAALPLNNLKFEIKSVSLHQIAFHSLSFAAASADATVELRDLVLRWQFMPGFSPQLQQVSLGSGQLQLAQWPESDSKSQQSPKLSLPSSWQLPDNLPASITISALNIALPCGNQRCNYQLSAELTHAAEQLLLTVNATDPSNPDSTGLTLSADYQIMQNLPLFNAKLTLDNSVTLSLSQQLQQHSSLIADGELVLLIAPPSPWLLQQLHYWQVELPPEALARFTTAITLQSRWQFDVPDKMDLASFSQHASGHMQLHADLPTPLSIPSVGQLQGDLQAELALTGGELSHYKLNSALTLAQPQLPASLRQYGLNAEQLAISLSSDGNTTPQLTALPLHLAVHSTGDSQLRFNADAMLNLTPPMSMMLRNGTLQLTQAQLAPTADSAEDMKLQHLTLDSSFDAYWLVDNWQLTLHNSTAKIGKLALGDSSASELNATFALSQFSGNADFSTLQLDTQLQLSVKQLQHRALKPLSWQWQGKLSGNINKLTADARLTNSADLAVNHQLTYQKDNIQLDWQLDELFLLAGNPLQASFTQWPALLDLNRGRINSHGMVRLSPQQAFSATVNLSGVSGIYDRSLFKDLNAPLTLGYQGDKFHLSTNDTTLKEIQHGLIAGPVKLTAQYHADANTPGAGILDLQQLQILAMGGQITVQPVQLDLAMDKQQVVLQLQRIELAQLLQQHPTTDLSGHGRISGTVPVLITRAGISVKQGYVAAESPGGVLQYRPPAAKNMASGNQGMKVVLDALDDFHYSVLSSDVNYDTEGQLTLKLNLQGKNPALEAGRAVNLNINLQEDIPALITSLQLSSQISDKIKQRVQQHLQQSGAKRANGVKL